jgi:Na+/citrate or Na+/malate symporter
MAGGVGEGAIPLSIGYSTLGGGEQGVIFARILPAVMMGSLTAIVLAGILNMIGRRKPSWSGDGALTIGEHSMPDERAATTSVLDPSMIAASMTLITLLYLLGVLAQQILGWPAPVVMLGLTVLAKLARAFPTELEQGAFRIFGFFRTAVTYPLLFAIGVAMTPWEELMAALRIENVITIFVTVATMIGSAFLVARKFGLYPIEAAVVAACHSGQGGTGDVAILTAANRLRLMPFAQIATRIGGAITVTMALLLYRTFGPGG